MTALTRLLPNFESNELAVSKNNESFAPNNKMLEIYAQLHNYIIKIELVYLDIKIKPYDTQKHVYVHDYIFDA